MYTNNKKKKKNNDFFFKKMHKKNYKRNVKRKVYEIYQCFISLKRADGFLSISFLLFAYKSIVKTFSYINH